MAETRSLPALIALGTLSSVFFSATFILNYTMHLAGGHWLWSAIGRYVFMIFLISILIILRSGLRGLLDIVALFFTHWMFWLLTGSIGFGIFYAGICFAGDYSRGWVVAATWQSTVLLSPFVLMAFGFAFPIRGIVLSSAIFLGVLLVHYQELRNGLPTNDVLYGIVPVLISSVAYPVGNQLLNAAKNGTISWVPHIRSDLLKTSTNCVLLLSIGSIPFWLLLYIVVQPPQPSATQYLSTFFVALSSGVIATGLFLHARNLTSSPYRIAAVDATLSAEVVVTLVIEMALLGLPLPDMPSLAGLALITLGLIAYCFRLSENSAP